MKIFIFYLYWQCRRKTQSRRVSGNTAIVYFWIHIEQAMTFINLRNFFFFFFFTPFSATFLRILVVSIN